MTDDWDDAAVILTPDPPKKLHWTCTKCGSEAQPVQDPKFGAFTQFDRRYTVGYCDTCSDPLPKQPRKTPRATQRIVLTEHFDRVDFERRKEMDELASLVRDVSAGKHIVQLPESQAIRLVHLYDKHGYAGFYLPASIRDAVAEHLRKADVRESYKPKKPAKQKRSRGA